MVFGLPWKVEEEEGEEQDDNRLLRKCKLHSEVRVIGSPAERNSSKNSSASSSVYQCNKTKQEK